MSSASILVISRGFPPAYLFGGPTRSVGNLTAALENDFDFSVLTSARDVGESAVLAGITAECWVQRGRVKVWYSSALKPANVLRCLRELKPDLVYLNSLFDVRFSLAPLLVTFTARTGTPVLLAPRGELSRGALNLKAIRKRIFLRGFRLLGLQHRVTWHASTEREANDIRRVFGSIDVAVAAPISTSSTVLYAPRDHSGALRLVFLGRIAPMKNVFGLLNAVVAARTALELTIAGPIEDREYWARCEELIAKLPVDKVVRYVGPIPNEDVLAEFSKHDLFVFPTHGENFGHVVLESLLAGTPVVVGSDSPWEAVEREGAGWLCDSEDIPQIAALIDRFSDLTPEGRSQMRSSAADLGRRIGAGVEAVNASRRMIEGVLGRSRRSPIRRTRLRGASRRLKTKPSAASSGTPHRLRVAMVMRRPLPGQFSVERAFSEVCKALPDDIEATMVQVPFRSSGFFRRAANVAFVRSLRADVVHVTGDISYCALGASRKRTVVTILDLVSVRRLHGVRRYVLLLLWYRFPVRWAEVVSTISEAARAELVQLVPSAARKVRMIPIPRTMQPREGIDKLQANPFVLLQVGTASHKNLNLVAEAAAHLPLELRIIGRLTDEQKNHLDACRILYSSSADLTDSEMVEEYSRADALVFVSMYEGFGLPILEAQAARLPVITSARPPMSDVAGDGALLVSPEDPAAIRGAVLRLINEPDLRSSIVTAGVCNVERFSPELVAMQYADLYKDIARRLVCRTARFRPSGVRGYFGDGSGQGPTSGWD